MCDIVQIDGQHLHVNYCYASSFGGPTMALYRLLREASFDQADITRMTAAYEAALQLLRLKDRNDPITELVAAKIIQVTRSGESDPPRICARALKELGVPVPD